jgi:hypothetical protein
MPTSLIDGDSAFIICWRNKNRPHLRSSTASFCEPYHQMLPYCYEKTKRRQLPCFKYSAITRLRNVWHEVPLALFVSEAEWCPERKKGTGEPILQRKWLLIRSRRWLVQIPFASEHMPPSRGRKRVRDFWTLSWLFWSMAHSETMSCSWKFNYNSCNESL